MNKEQYKSANKTAYTVVAVILGCFLLSTMMGAFMNGFRLRQIILMSVCGLALVVCTFALILKRDCRAGATILMASASAAYMTLALGGSSDGMYAYAFPILLSSMVYFNVRLVVCGNVIIVVTNILRFVLHKNRADNVFVQEWSVSMIVVLLCAYASISIIRLLTKFNKEKLEEISAAAEQQKGNNDRMKTVAQDIMDSFGHAMKELDALQEGVDTCNLAMTNITDSTESTANAIQQQASMCAEIQQNTDKAETGINEMIQASDRTDRTVTDGAEVMKRLRKQSESVETASRNTVEVIGRLTEKVEKVESIVSSILTISGQTNLLALNASIEAARAGDAGRGFAVVAEEIRHLSEQTKEASNNITQIIAELNEDTKQAGASIDDSAASVREQNRLIEDAQAKFSAMNEEIAALSRNIRGTEQLIQEILDSTGVISDNITQLSATSEEIAASSTEGLHTSEATVQNMKSCREVLEKIYESAKEL